VLIWINLSTRSSYLTTATATATADSGSVNSSVSVNNDSGSGSGSGYVSRSGTVLAGTLLLSSVLLLPNYFMRLLRVLEPDCVLGGVLGQVGRAGQRAGRSRGGGDDRGLAVSGSGELMLVQLDRGDQGGSNGISLEMWR
jgi:hypothetical protein